MADVTIGQHGGLYEGIPTERIAIEVALFGIVLIASGGVIATQNIAMSSSTFVAIASSMYLCSRVYFAATTSGVNTIIKMISPKAAVPRSDAEDEDEDEDEEEEKKQKQATWKTHNNVVYRVMVSLTFIFGIVLVYHTVPQAQEITRKTMQSLFGDAPLLIWAAGTKDRTRAYDRVKTIAGALVGWFALLFVLELCLRFIMFSLGFLYRSVMSKGKDEGNGESVTVQEDIKNSEDLAKEVTGDIDE
mgnify:CR=1 FL=1